MQGQLTRCYVGLSVSLILPLTVGPTLQRRNFGLKSGSETNPCPSCPEVTLLVLSKPILVAVAVTDKKRQKLSIYEGDTGMESVEIEAERVN